MHPVATSADIDYVIEHANAVLVPADHARGHHRHLGGPASAAAAAGQGGHQLGEGVARAHGRLARAGPDGHRRRQAHHLPRDGQGRGRLRDRQPRHQRCRPSRTTSRSSAPRACRCSSARHARSARSTAGPGRAWTTCCTGTAPCWASSSSSSTPTRRSPSRSKNADAYIRAEIVYAASHEGALHLDDVLMHRTRLNYEQADKGVGALEEIADLVAPRARLGRADAQPGDRGVPRPRRGRGRRRAGARRRRGARRSDCAPPTSRRCSTTRRSRAGTKPGSPAGKGSSGPVGHLRDSPRPSAGRT